ncbi:MAG: CAP domain-containing protein [Hyphomicrobiaceae bacterium]|nr:CAP domain-containing protein [Hyphomicrobiaceae bacterium]
MYRVLVPLLFGLLCGCSMANSSGVSAGFAGDEQPTSSVASSRLASEPSQSSSAASEGTPKRYASNDDHIPKGTFEKAPSGALANRDYGSTQLDPDKARELINAYRRQKGLKPLKLNAALTEAAKAHSRDLAKWDRISHYGSDGSNPWDRVKRAGYNAKVAAENVGTGQASLEEVIKGWQASPGHNKNLLLADVEHMGIALVQDPRTEFKTFWTLVVGASL